MGRRDIDDGQYIPIAKLLADLAGIFAHVTKEQAAAAGWRSRPDHVLHDFLALVTVEGLWVQGEMALWGQLLVAGGKPLVNPPDEPHRRRKLMRIPATLEVGGFSLILEDDGAWSVGGDDGNWRWVDIRVTPRSYQTAVAEAKDRLRIIGEHRKAISDKALREYVNAHPTLGRPRIYGELKKAGYSVTKQRVESALAIRDAGKRLIGGRERRQLARAG